MLVLTRKLGEQVLMDNGKFTVKVLAVKGSTVALGFNAPSGVDIDREEIYLRKQAETEAANTDTERKTLKHWFSHYFTGRK